jgi:GTP diphosphokinase / guanosine-3',5'-bis(diphosphate) 3'-diphosphatase
VNIHSGSFQSNMDGNAVMEFTVEVKDLQQLYGVLDKIRGVESVTEAVRVS